MTRKTAGCLLAVMLWLPVGCGDAVDSETVEAPTVDTREMVATNSEVSISAADVEAHLELHGPHASRRFAASATQRRRVARKLMQQETLYLRARQQGLHLSPRVRQRVRRIVVNALLEQLRQDLAGQVQVSKAEVERELSRQRGPARERVRVSRLRFATEKQATSAIRKLKPSPNRYVAFMKLARKQGDTAAGTLPGDLGFFGRNSRKVPAELVRAAFEGTRLWQLSAPIKTKGGWNVLLKTGHQRPARGDDMRRQAVRARLEQQKRDQLMQHHIAELARLDQLKIYEQRLARIKPVTSKRSRP